MPSDNFSLGLKENVYLKEYTTFKIGGTARYFFNAKEKNEIIEALKFARKNKIPFFILGSGSNVLVADEGFNGLVIHINLQKYNLNGNTLYAETGVLVETLVDVTVNKGLAGFEWAGGLPGTLGGAIFGNAGAFGGEIKDSIVWVEALDNKLRIRKLNKKECQFGYRSSIFKKKNWTVLSAKLKFKEGDKKILCRIVKSYIQYRKEKGPLLYPNAGSIFKNYDVKRAPKKMIEMFKGVIKKDPFPVIPAAAIIAKVPNLVGYRIGGAQISEKHPNFIINLGQARAKDVKNLIEFVKKEVKNYFGIALEEEIRYVGF